MLKYQPLPLLYVGSLCVDIKNLFDAVNVILVEFVQRRKNGVAHKLVQIRLSSPSENRWIDIPSVIISGVLLDNCP